MLRFMSVGCRYRFRRRYRSRYRYFTMCVGMMSISVSPPISEVDIDIRRCVSICCRHRFRRRSRSRCPYVTICVGMMSISVSVPRMMSVSASWPYRSILKFYDVCRYDVDIVFGADRENVDIDVARFVSICCRCRLRRGYKITSREVILFRNGATVSLTKASDIDKNHCYARLCTSVSMSLSFL